MSAQLHSKWSEESRSSAALMVALLISSGLSYPISTGISNNELLPGITIQIGLAPGAPPQTSIAMAIPATSTGNGIWSATTLGAPESSPVLALLPEVWFDSARKRSRLQISVDILELLKGGPLTPFDIAFRLRLNSKRTKRYLESLTEQESLETIERDEKILYGITPGGISALERVRTVLFLDN